MSKEWYDVFYVSSIGSHKEFVLCHSTNNLQLAKSSVDGSKIPMAVCDRNNATIYDNEARLNAPKPAKKLWTPPKKVQFTSPTEAKP